MSNLNLTKENPYLFFKVFFKESIIYYSFILLIVCLFVIGFVHASGYFEQPIEWFGLAIYFWLVFNVNTAFLLSYGKVTRKEVANSAFTSIPVFVVIAEIWFMDGGKLGEYIASIIKEWRPLAGILIATPLFIWISVICTFPSILAVKWLGGIVLSAWYSWIGIEQHQDTSKPQEQVISKKGENSVLRGMHQHGYEFAGKNVGTGSIYIRKSVGGSDKESLTQWLNSIGWKIRMIDGETEVYQ